MTKQPISSELSAKFTNMSFVCACLVVFIHVQTPGLIEGSAYDFIQYFFKVVLGRIAVPFFFAVSGYFLAGQVNIGKWWRFAVSKRVRSLLLPYCIVSVVSFLFVFIGQYFGECFFHTGGSCKITWQSIVDVLGIDMSSYPYVVPLWFVRSLFLFVIISFPIVRVIQFGTAAGLFLFCAFLLVSIIVPASNGFLRCTFNLPGLLFFTAGVFCRINGSRAICKLVSLHSSRLLVCVGWALLAIGSAFVKFDSQISWIFRVATMLVGLFLVVPAIPWPRLLVKSVFAIYLFHWLYLQLYFDVARNIMMARMFVESWFGYLCAGTLAIVSCILFVSLIRKCAPKISSVLLGGR